MKIDCPPGLFSDDPLMGGPPVWQWGENVRFVRGRPETIGQFGVVMNGASPVAFPIYGGKVDIWTDANITIVAYGNTISVFDWDTGVTSTFVVEECPGDGRWWFDATETDIIAGKDSLDLASAIIAVSRSDLSYSVLANAPAGATAGGIVGGILLLAGNVGSFATNDPRLLVRWSARRTDPSSSGLPEGPFGFEDWTPSDVNSSGEVPLDGASRIVGGGRTSFGFLVWTDTRLHSFRPRDDTFAFSEGEVAPRGLLSAASWVEADGRVWWMDPTRQMCVFDGGAFRSMPNPITKATVDRMDLARIDLCHMAALSKTSEVVFSFPDNDGTIRQLVYNYSENCWYHWSLPRLGFLDQQLSRPVIGVGDDGTMFAHELATFLPDSYLDRLRPGGMPMPGDSQPPPLVSGFGVDLQPLPFFITTSMLTDAEMARTALRSTDIVVPHVRSRSCALVAEPANSYHVEVVSYDTLSEDSVVLREGVTLPIGTVQTQMRVGGKALRFTVSSPALCSHLRLGVPEILTKPGGVR